LNSQIKATVNESQINSLARTLHRIHETTYKSSRDIIRQAMYFACQSAAKATKPTGSKLTDKYKYRPIVKRGKMTKNGKYLYMYNDDEWFATEKLISAKNLARQGIKRVERAIQLWNKKTNEWDYVPYIGSSSKYDKNLKAGKIPGSGAAKMGWKGAFGKLGYSIEMDGMNKGQRLSSLMDFGNELKAHLTVRNLVDYTQKTSPESASTGLRAAENRMYGTYLKKLDSQIQGVCNRA
jgi:hypothetical protein